jgi:hypothetical protein
MLKPWQLYYMLYNISKHIFLILKNLIKKLNEKIVMHQLSGSHN